MIPGICPKSIGFLEDAVLWLNSWPNQKKLGIKVFFSVPDEMEASRGKQRFGENTEIVYSNSKYEIVCDNIIYVSNNILDIFKKNSNENEFVLNL